MVWNNTKLLARLYYRPVSATSDIIDEASWIYAAILVVVVSVLMNVVVFTHIYTGYEAVARPLSEKEIARLESFRQKEFKGVPRKAGEEEYFDEAAVPRVVFDQIGRASCRER